MPGCPFITLRADRRPFDGPIADPGADLDRFSHWRWFVGQQMGPLRWTRYDHIYAPHAKGNPTGIMQIGLAEFTRQLARATAGTKHLEPASNLALPVYPEFVVVFTVYQSRKAFLPHLVL